MKVAARAVCIKKLITAAAFCTICGFVNPSEAQKSGQGTVSIMMLGTGGTSCGTALNYLNGDVSRQLLIEWVAGYLSALNSVVTHQRKLPDTDSVGAYIEKHCREKPLATVADSAKSLWGELKQISAQ